MGIVGTGTGPGATQTLPGDPPRVVGGRGGRRGRRWRHAVQRARERIEARAEALARAWLEGPGFGQLEAFMRELNAWVTRFFEAANEVFERLNRMILDALARALGPPIITGVKGPENRPESIEGPEQFRSIFGDCEDPLLLRAEGKPIGQA